MDDHSEGQDFVLLDDNDIDGYNDDEILQQAPEVLAEIQKWLQPTDYGAESSEYNKHLNSHVPGTGLWIQETEAYRQWHDSSDHGSLWTKAIAGAGKSVFAAMIANKLKIEENVPVVTFFFRQIIATNHDPQSLVRDWISMTLNHSPPLQARMKKYMDDRRALHNISTNEFWQDILQALVSLPKVYCIVDALDEMDIDKQDFFKNLVSLGKRRPSSIKLVMTSRPLPRIEAFLKDPSILQVRLEQLKVDKDIALYVDYRLDRHSEMNSELRSAVKQAIGLKAQGSFLYARLMMDELLDHMKQMIPDIKFIQRSLDWLPLTLEDMYNGMLYDHALRTQIPQHLQLTILQWVTHSSRPLRLLELAAMLDSQNKSGKVAKDTKAVVRAACGPLLEILEDETVSVIHHSFTEFLTDSGRTSREAPHNSHPQFPVIDSQEAHKSMGHTCLGYLGSGCLLSWKLEERDDDADFYYPRNKTQQGIKMSFPFLDYAMNNWYVHIRKAGSLDALLLGELDAFMKTDNCHFRAWIDMVWAHTKNLSKVSALHVSSWAGISVYVKHIIERGDEINGRDNRDRTPLSWAAAKGHTEVVALLLEKVPDPDLDDYNGLKPLHYAAQVNHHAIVKLLLSAGVSPLTGKTRDPGRRCGNSPSTIGESPLMYASQSGCAESVQEMIPYLDTKDLNRALGWAATHGKIQVVDLLLALPQVSAEPPEHMDAPLFLASKGLHYQVMQALLKHGADPNKRSVNYRHMMSMSESGSTPMHAVCGPNGPRGVSRQSDPENMAKCSRLLLDAGGDINAIDGSGKTPLHYAVGEKGGDQEDDSITKILLEAGADPSVVDNSGDTPLHLVSLHKDSGSLIELLLAHGASLDVRRSSDGRTPVHAMMNCIHEINVKPLLPHVKDWNIRDSKGNSPLHILLSTSYHPAGTLQDLLDAGADLNCRNKAGEAAIHALKETMPGGNNSVLPSLIAAGADLETKDKEGRTYLLRMLNRHMHHSEDPLKHVLNLGADIKARDYNGDDILHLVCRKVHNTNMVQNLLATGADPLTTNHAGNTLLHEVMATYTAGDAEYTVGLINILLDAGIPAGARNNLGQTPFHVAMTLSPPSYLGPEKLDPLEEIFKTGLSDFINAEDSSGVRPIHLAATISEFLVARLIRHGADATAVTNDDMSLLHIAARARESNVIGLLLEHFSSTGRTDILHLRDSVGRTALHYACRSGRPESVALLLKAGAAPDILDNNERSPLHACIEFEQERIQQDTDLERPNPLRPVSLNDFWNQQRQKGQRRSMWSSISTEDDTTRIREIIRLLIDYGSPVIFSRDHAFRRAQNSSPLILAVSEGCAEMVDELLPVVEKAMAAAKAENKPWASSTAQPFQQQYLLNTINPELSTDYIGKDGDAQQISNYLLALRQHKAIEKLPALGADFTPRPGNWDLFTTLARYGYVSMLDKLGSSISKPGWVNGIESQSQNPHDSLRPYLITAASRSLPNLDMIKLLVEKFGADVNIQPKVRVYRSGGSEIMPDGSALHILCQANYWWQTEAIEYLLSQGASTELRNQNGQTPLDVAISKDHSMGTYRRRETAKILLEHGANPNVMDEKGLTCLNKAMHDIELVRLLIKHGADISFGDQSVLFSAINAQDVQAVAALLESGADCNIKPKPIDRSKLLPHQRTNNRMVDAEYYALHYAANPKFNTTKKRDSAIQILNLLLKHGANPYIQYSEDGTILHDIMQTGGIIDPFLELPDLQLEHRDPKGRTLLLAACQSGYASTNPAAGRPQSFLHSNTPSRLPQRKLGDPCQCLVIFEKGGDLTAVDHEGNNVLHLMLQAGHDGDEFKRAFRMFFDKAPSLVAQKNAQGNTPFHVATSGQRFWARDTLMEAGADPLDKDGDGKTTLHYLAHHLCSPSAGESWLPMFKRFLDLGLSINEKDNVGQTPVFGYFASSSGSLFGPGSMFGQGNPCTHREFYQPWEDAGADLFARNNTGETLLHVVAKQTANDRFNRSTRDTVDTFKFLIERGLDPMAEDNNQRTALDVAAACSNDAVLALFKRDKQ